MNGRHNPTIRGGSVSSFGRLIPATVDGTPVERAVVIPITWQLPPLKPAPKVDPSNPPHIGEAYYPPESKRRGEQGKCKVRVTVTARGRIRDIKLTESTGYPRLDQACVKAFEHGGLLPAMVDGKPIDMTVEIPIVWMLITETST
jgi:TonB family protein